MYFDFNTCREKKIINKFLNVDLADTKMRDSNILPLISYMYRKCNPVGLGVIYMYSLTFEYTDFLIY